MALRTARQEFVPELSDLQVEHVMPQKWKPADYPMKEGTAEAVERRDRLVHSIGNLTLVTGSFNKQLSNEGFTLKRPEIATSSSLVLNAYFQRFACGLLGRGRDCRKTMPCCDALNVGRIRCNDPFSVDRASSPGAAP